MTIIRFFLLMTPNKLKVNNKSVIKYTNVKIKTNERQYNDDNIIPEDKQNKLIKYWVEVKKFYPRKIIDKHIAVNSIVTMKAYIRFIVSLSHIIPRQEYSDLINLVLLLNEIQICCNYKIYKDYMWFLDSNFANIINTKKNYKYQSLYDNDIIEEIRYKIKIKYRNRIIKKVLTLGILS